MSFASFAELASIAEIAARLGGARSRQLVAPVAPLTALSPPSVEVAVGVGGVVVEVSSSVCVAKYQIATPIAITRITAITTPRPPPPPAPRRPNRRPRGP